MKKPVLKPFASLEIKVDPPITIGETSLGLRRFIPIRSGTITGEVKGRILPGGADSQMIRANGRIDLSARYVIETADHELIYIENNGIRQVSEPFRKQAAAGEIIEPEHVYFVRYRRLKQAVKSINGSMTACLSVPQKEPLITFY
ncbi:hypothetical protein ABIA50_000860 [Bacillus subtilis]